MKQSQLILPTAFLLGVATTAYGAEATIETLQSDVAVTKTKTDAMTSRIQSLEGGLPAERAAREAADALLQAGSMK